MNIGDLYNGEKKLKIYLINVQIGPVNNATTSGKTNDHYES